MLKLPPSDILGGLLLILATLVAFGAANSSFSEHYLFLVQYPLGSHTVLEWVNDALMAVFFFYIGLEIKREVLTGHLSTAKKGMLPILSACGGAVVPALIYFSFNPAGPATRGWGVPMATDIAFAVGILALVGRGLPTALKTFLLALAIADDLIAILVIALFYGGKLSISWLFASCAVFTALAFLARSRSWNTIFFLALGVVGWYCVFQSGIHATIAGVMLGLLTPDRVPGKDTSPIDRLMHALHLWVAFLIMPVFALANAGVDIRLISNLGAFNNRVFSGVFWGLLVGKPVGIFMTAWITTKLKITHLPMGVYFRHIFGAGLLAGIGFTMALFISELAFEEEMLKNFAKIAILFASLVASVVGGLWFKLIPKV